MVTTTTIAAVLVISVFQTDASVKLAIILLKTIVASDFRHVCRVILTAIIISALDRQNGKLAWLAKTR